jgi:hypothetical protein
MTQPSTTTETFHQPTTGTATSPVATCGTCGRGIARQNGGSALWTDADGSTGCKLKPAALQPPAVAAPFTADQIRQLAFAGDQVRLVSARNGIEIPATRYLYQLAENTWDGDYRGLADALNAESVRLDNPITA